MELKNTVYWQIFSDVWGLMKQFFPVQGNDGYWDGLIKAANDVYGKYKGTEQAEFAKQQILTVLNELDRIHHVKGGNK